MSPAHALGSSQAAQGSVRTHSSSTLTSRTFRDVVVNADAAKDRPKEINVGIDAQGRYVIDKTVFTWTNAGALADELKRVAGAAKDPVIVISADASATHQSVVNVMEAARQAGLVHITFATQTGGARK